MGKITDNRENVNAWQLKNKPLDEQNSSLIDQVEKLPSRISILEQDLDESHNTIDLLTEELILKVQKSGQSIQVMYNQLKAAESDQDKFQTEVVVLSKQLEMAQALADERDAVATEAHQVDTGFYFSS